MPGMGPLVVRPRLDEKPWGGDRLKGFGYHGPGAEPLGEAVMTVAGAEIAGMNVGHRTLGEVVAASTEAWLGTRGMVATGERPIFPLLVKLLDAGQNLSLQVHPDDVAACNLGSLGKTEAWYVVDAAPGAQLYAGLREGVTTSDVQDACEAGGGRLPSLLRQLPAVPGTCILLPAGTVHALGAGVLVYEVQQASDITFRLYDWDRHDANGRPRKLHVDAGIAAVDAAMRPRPIPPLRLPSGAGRRQMLVACRYFALERIAAAAGERIRVALPRNTSPQTFTALRGSAMVVSAERSTALRTGETAVVSADTGGVVLEAITPVVVVRSWIPDPWHEIVVPALTGGANHDAISALGEPLGDLRHLLASHLPR